MDEKTAKPWLRPCTAVYLLLMALTLATWAIGKAGLSGSNITLLVLAFALIKGWLVGDFFMGLRGVRGFWRWPVILWLAIPGGLIAYAFTGG